MANKKQIKQALNQYFSIKDIQEVAKFWDVDNPEDTSSFDIVNRKEFRIETTYTDSGYGDDDRTGKVWYYNFYRVCPHCNKETFKNRLFLNIEEEYTRYGEVI